VLRSIDISGLRAGTLTLQEVKRRLRETLSALRGAYPQIPADAKKLDLVVDRLAKEAADAVNAADISMAALSRRMHGLRINGMGQASQLWPQLFSLPLAPAPAGKSINVAAAPREELAGFLTEMWGSHFAGAPGKLAWIIAATVAWRPRSLRELHRRIERVAAPFPAFDEFEKACAPAFSFAAAHGAEPKSPDWALLWEYEGASGYGGDYPADVRDFLAAFLSSVRDRDPRASILDIGTGSHAATLLARAASAGFELTGIDVADLPAPPEAARIQIRKMSADRLEFPGEAFAAVMSVNGIEYADLDIALPEMRRVMRPGAPGALVLHRPDSLIVERSRAFVDFLESALLLETLALTWLFLHSGDGAAERELVRQLLDLQKRKVDARFVRYFNRVMHGIPDAVDKRQAAPAEAHELVRRFETDLRWTCERDRFLISHMARIPIQREKVAEWLAGYGFEVDSVRDVFLDADHGVAPVGWAIRLHKPAAA
jgi:ubiquinone/menaquinone biosynthesis C-methylase UbiE